ncbi:MAG: hypothetical protein MJ102_07485 [Clostridia bacterium]|nr:hypothetical protein [Clostridia bacterium]
MADGDIFSLLSGLNSGTDLGGMVSRLMADPELVSRIAQVVGGDGIVADAEAEETVPASAGAQTERAERSAESERTSHSAGKTPKSEPVPQADGDVIASVLSMLGGSRGFGGNGGEYGKHGSDGRKDGGFGQGHGCDSDFKDHHECRTDGGKHGAHGDSAKRCALLLALRPYCSARRQRTIDRMVSISKLSGTLKNFEKAASPAGKNGDGREV